MSYSIYDAVISGIHLTDLESASTDRISDESSSSIPDSDPILDDIHGAPRVPTRLALFMSGRSVTLATSQGRVSSSSSSSSSSASLGGGGAAAVPEDIAREYCMLPADKELDEERQKVMSTKSVGLGCELCKFPPALAHTSPQLRQFHEAAKAFTSDVTDIGACEQLAALFNRLIYDTDRAAEGRDNVRKITAGDVMDHRTHSMHLHTGDINVYNDLIRTLHASIVHVQRTGMYFMKDSGAVMVDSEGSKLFFKLINEFRRMTESRQKRISGNLRSATGNGATNSSSSSANGKSGKKGNATNGTGDNQISFLANLGDE